MQYEDIVLRYSPRVEGGIQIFDAANSKFFIFYFLISEMFFFPWFLLFKVLNAILARLVSFNNSMEVYVRKRAPVYGMLLISKKVQ